MHFLYFLYTFILFHDQFCLASHVIWYDLVDFSFRYPIESRVVNDLVLIMVVWLFSPYVRLTPLASYFIYLRIEILQKCRKVQISIGIKVHFLYKYLHFVPGIVYFAKRSFYVLCKPLKQGMFSCLPYKRGAVDICTMRMHLSPCGGATRMRQAPKMDARVGESHRVGRTV